MHFSLRSLISPTYTYVFSLHVESESLFVDTDFLHPPTFSATTVAKLTRQRTTGGRAGGRARGREGERGLAKAEGRAELLVLPEMPMRKENKSGWLAGSEFRSLTEEILFP